MNVIPQKTATITMNCPGIVSQMTCSLVGPAYPYPVCLLPKEILEQDQFIRSASARRFHVSTRAGKPPKPMSNAHTFRRPADNTPMIPIEVGIIDRYAGPG
jgi:hypothetical protein